MIIRFRCPACQRRAKAPEERAGAVAKCAHCGALLRVPPASAVVADPEGIEAELVARPSQPPPPAPAREMHSGSVVQPSMSAIQAAVASAPDGFGGLPGGSSAGGSSAGGSSASSTAASPGGPVAAPSAGGHPQSLVDWAAANASGSNFGLPGASGSAMDAASRSGILPAMPAKTHAGGGGSTTTSGVHDHLHVPDDEPPGVREPLPPGLPLRGELLESDAALTSEMYVRFVAQSGLIERDVLVAALQQLEAANRGRTPDPRQIGNYLVGSRLLTTWQDRMLRRGLYKGFFLQRYRLLKMLGAGGMGSVFLAEHMMLKRLVAVKILQSAKATHLQRFFRESQTTAQLDHPNVVKLYDFDTTGELYYMMLEFIDGPNFQDYVEQHKPLGYAAAANFISQAAAGLHYAHDLGLVHRDVKPANLLLNPKGVVKISDLGLARPVEMEGPSVTVEEGGLLGTTDYLSPEQAIDSSNVDGRADIYSLGCTLHFLITGLPPFHTGSMAQRLLMHQMQPAPRLKKFRPDAPDALQAIVDVMMSKSADARPTAAQVRQRLAFYVAMNPDRPAPKQPANP